MNRLLAETLSALNGLIAIVIIAAGALIGYRFAGTGMGATIGAMVGLLLAALSCGTIAFLALIERHLSCLVSAKGGTTDDEPPAHHRREPTL